MSVILHLITLGGPKILVQIALALVVENDAFAFEEALLQIYRDRHLSRRTGALGIDHALPWDILGIRTMHDIADRPRRVTLTEHFRELSIRHYSSGRDLSDDLVDTLAIVLVVGWVHNP